MENKFESNFKNEGAGDAYVNFKIWQLLVVGLAFIVIIANAFISSDSVMLWIVNFLLQLAVFSAFASILAVIFKAIFKKDWAGAFAVVLLLCCLFGLYDSIRGYNYRKDAEQAYERELEKAKQQQAAQQQQQAPANQSVVGN